MFDQSDEIAIDFKMNIIIKTFTFFSKCLHMQKIQFQRPKIPGSMSLDMLPNRDFINY
jgi:hypothetical protein